MIWLYNITITKLHKIIYVLHELIHAFNYNIFIDFLFYIPIKFTKIMVYIGILYYLFTTMYVHGKYILCIFYTIHRIILRVFKFQ